MSDPTPEQIATARARLLNGVDTSSASAIANALGDVVNETLNSMGVDAGVSLVARALTARALLRVASAWWTDLMPMLPRDITLATLRDIADNLPPEISDHVYLDPEIVADELARRGEKPH